MVLFHFYRLTRPCRVSGLEYLYFLLAERRDLVTLKYDYGSVFFANRSELVVAE